MSLNAQAPTELTIRRLSIDLSQGFSRHWNGGDAFLTAYTNALSMSFPVGEQFFIDSVKNGAKALPDTPENADLAKVIKGFIGQEATHRQLHGLYNAHLERQGLVNHWGPRSQKRIERAYRLLFNQSQDGYLHALALTAAFEHYTAIFGDITLERADQPGDWFGGAEEPLKTMWRWHAAEESDHKCVAFDLYQRLGGNYARRMRWFWFATIQFSIDVMRQTINNLWHDKTLFKPSTWWSASKFFFGRHGMVWRVAKPAWAYARRDFHPMQLGDPTQANNWLTAHADQWTAVGAKA